MLMKFKFLAIISGLIALSCLSFRAYAQDDKAQIPKEDAGKEMSFLRVWWIVDASPSGATIQDAAVGFPPISIPFSDRPNSVGSYAPLPAGKHKIEVVVGGQLLDPVEFQARPDTFHTLIVTDLDGTVKATLVSDTMSEGDVGRLRFYNFAKGKNATISVASDSLVSVVPGSFKEFIVPKKKKFPVSVKVDLGNGIDARSDTDVEPIASGATSLIVLPDAYGRFRPRFYADALFTLE